MRSLRLRGAPRPDVTHGAVNHIHDRIQNCSSLLKPTPVENIRKIRDAGFDVRAPIKADQDTDLLATDE